MRKALHRRQSYQRLGACLRGCYVSTVLGKYGGNE
jgi:hypothetical protein